MAETEAANKSFFFDFFFFFSFVSRFGRRSKTSFVSCYLLCSSYGGSSECGWVFRNVCAHTDGGVSALSALPHISVSIDMQRDYVFFGLVLICLCAKRVSPTMSMRSLVCARSRYYNTQCMSIVLVGTGGMAEGVWWEIRRINFAVAFGENFSKTLNCYLLIKYWFKITSFFGGGGHVNCHNHRCHENYFSFTHILARMKPFTGFEKCCGRQTTEAINRSLSLCFIFIREIIFCRVWVVSGALFIPPLERYRTMGDEIHIVCSLPMTHVTSCA